MIIGRWILLGGLIRASRIVNTPRIWKIKTIIPLRLLSRANSLLLSRHVKIKKVRSTDSKKQKTKKNKGKLKADKNDVYSYIYSQVRPTKKHMLLKGKISTRKQNLQSNDQ